MLTPDLTWLEIPEAAQLRALVGSVLSIVLVLCVGAIAVSAVGWGLHRLGWRRLGDGALENIGRALVAAVLLGALSGIVGFGSGLIVL